MPNRIDYDLEIPVTAEFTIAALYAAAASRPVEIHIDGCRVHTGLAAVTGSWLLAYIHDPDVIERIRRHLNRSDPPAPRPFR